MARNDDINLVNSPASNAWPIKIQLQACINSAASGAAILQRVTKTHTESSY